MNEELIREWEYEHGSWQCSKCGRSPNGQGYWDFEDGNPNFKFCPNCGAKMEELSNDT